jgi:alkylation response protein AidB-like acyl-CoA dehydrogenase
MSPFGEAYGGAGLSEGIRQPELCAILRVLGSADLSIARLFEGHVNAIALVCRYGNSRQIEELAESAARDNLAAVWGADDAAGLKIDRTSGQPRLKGHKILASGAGIVTRPLVTAADEQGQVLCLLRLSGSEPVDISGWQALGMRSTATGAIELSGIAITEQERIGSPGDFMRQPFFSGGAWRFCAAHLGAVERLVDLYREHLISRGRGADPYQLERLAQSIASAKTARFWVEEAARRFAGDSSDLASVVAFVNLTRMVTERAALDVMETVQRGTGLTAFIRPNPIERISRDLATYLRQPVPDLAMADAAREMLTSSVSVGDL